MTRAYWLAGGSLLLALCIYSVYRTEQTVINVGWHWLLGSARFWQLRHYCLMALPFPPRFIIDVLPEGLWVFSTSLVSASSCRSPGRYRLASLTPVVLALLLELLQAVHLTNGRFDWADVLAIFIGWAMATLVLKTTRPPEPSPPRVTTSRFLVTLLYAALYLAHVNQK